MRFDEIIGRLTGISTPIGGVSWNPPLAESIIARKVITFSEGCRVLYNPLFAVQYGLDVEVELASILPAEDTDEDQG